MGRMADSNRKKPSGENELDGMTPLGDVGDSTDESEWEDSVGDEDPEEDF